jgi:hypothetical protein
MTSGLLLGVRPFVGDSGRGILRAVLYAVISPSSVSSPGPIHAGLALLNPMRLGDADCWCLNHPLPALRHAGGEYDRRELDSLYSELLLLRKPECCDGRSGMVGENSRASKSSMLAPRLAFESGSNVCGDILTEICIRSLGRSCLMRRSPVA